MYLNNIPETKPYTKDLYCPFLEIPDELLLHVLSYLPFQDMIHSVPLVCKKWHRISSDELLWEVFYRSLCLKLNKKQRELEDTFKKKYILDSLDEIERIKDLTKNFFQLLKKDILSLRYNIRENRNPIDARPISACRSKIYELVGKDQSGLLKIIELIVNGQKLLTIERLDNTQKAKRLASQICHSDMINPIMKFGNMEFPGYAISLNVFNPARKQMRSCLFKILFYKNELQQYLVDLKWDYTPKLRLLDYSFEWKYTPSCLSTYWFGIDESLLVFLRTLVKKGVAKLPKTACPSVFTLANPKE